jgi:hypothetical protein
LLHDNQPPTRTLMNTPDPPLPPTEPPPTEPPPTESPPSETTQDETTQDERPGIHQSPASVLQDTTDLLLQPLAFFRDLDTSRMVVPVYGYFFMSLTQGLQGISAESISSDNLPLVSVTIAMAALLGIPVAALMIGGILHVTASFLGGRRPMPHSIVAIGAALFWPGLLSSIASLASVMLVGLVPIDVLVTAWYAAALWALALTTTAMKALNGFSWVRAFSVWLVYLGSLTVGGWLIITGSRALGLI